MDTGLWRVCQLLAIILICTPPARALEESQISAICDAVSVAAASERGMPADALYAITLSETGRQRDGRLRPWPWTVNMEGRGFWFDTRAEAMAYVQEKFDAGARSFDVGCFQINYKWHHQNFDSLEAMFDPMTNARYAAKFLSDLFDETADWTRAAGAYHSRNETYASRYRTRYARIRGRLDGVPITPEVILPTIIETVRFPGVKHAFLSAPLLAVASPYGEATNPQSQNLPAPPAMLGSLMGGMLGGETVTLLTATNGSLF